MVTWIPEEPPVPPEQRAAGRVKLRFEDVSQDGRLVVESLSNALGVVWRSLDDSADARGLGARGVLPILSRVVLESGEGPIAVGGPTEAAGCWQLAHTASPSGAVERILLGMWGRIGSVVGVTHGFAPKDAGRPVVAGRIFAEHVFTRPFGPPGERKVRSLELGGRETVPEARLPWREPDALLALPEGAVPLDAELVPDAVATVFGLDHTDSNHHVNSLVHTRLFIEAALRRLDAHGRAGVPRLARSLEIAYRKPSFAGERGRVRVRAYTLGDTVGAVAALGVDGEARPRTFARVAFG